MFVSFLVYGLFFVKRGKEPSAWVKKGKERSLSVLSILSLLSILFYFLIHYMITVNFFLPFSYLSLELDGLGAYGDVECVLHSAFEVVGG